MVRFVFRSIVEISNPESPEDSVEVVTVAFTADESVGLADALAALGVEPAEWQAHKELAIAGSTALWVLTATRRFALGGVARM